MYVTTSHTTYGEKVRVLNSRALRATFGSEKERWSGSRMEMTVQCGAA
jgi:hypothetical protein